jgi:hypothetical protein
MTREVKSGRVEMVQEQYFWREILGVSEEFQTVDSGNNSSEIFLA